MSAVLPGRPQSRLQALATGFWNATHLSVYIAGNAFTILGGARLVLQTIYDDDEAPLEAVAVDEASGKIACCTRSSVRIYRPLELEHDSLKWSFETCFEIAHPEEDPNAACTLSWGASQELLVATSQLSLYSTTDGTATEVWQKKLPSPVKTASISHDSAYIVTVGFHDRLCKIWRRLSYGTDDVRFDVTYLRHPEVITAARWRPPYHPEQSADHVLYTFCADAALRTWTSTESPLGKHWRLWGKVDLGARADYGPLNPRDVQLAFIIDGRDFIPSVERAVTNRMADDASTDDVALDHLVAVARKTPEICVAVDSTGFLSAWALENVSSATAGSPSIFPIAQLKSRHFQRLDGFLSHGHLPHVEIQVYCERLSGQLHVLLHSFDGRVGVFRTSVADLFDPTANSRRFQLETIWSGHSASIHKIVRNFSGQAVVSRSVGGECIVWKHGRGSKGSAASLSRMSTIPHHGHIHRMSVLRKGRFVVTLHDGDIVLWDCRHATAVSMAQASFAMAGKLLCLIILPRPQVQDYTTAHIASITSERQGIVWEIKLPAYVSQPKATEGAGISEFCRFELKDAGELAYVLPVDPAGSQPVAHGVLDVFARDIAISYTKSGQVNFWTARVDIESRSVGWLSTCMTQTGVSEPALVSGSMLKKAALVNSTRSQVTIWDIGGSRLEYEDKHETHNIIQDLDWTSTPDSQSILAVGFQYRVVLLSQMRFDYLNKGPAWAPVRDIQLRELTPHPIGDSAWLSDGHLVVGTGNQMFIYDRNINGEDPNMSDARLPHLPSGSWDLFEAVQRFNGPLPLFHPQFLSQCILCGKSYLVRRILTELHKMLKYYIAGEAVDDYLGIDIEDLYMPQQALHQAKLKTRSSYLNDGFAGVNGQEEEDSFGEETAAAINEKLTKIRLPQLSGHEQIQLANIAECASFVEKHRRSLDENGARFMLLFRQYTLHKGRGKEISISWREINWAYHSTSQDILTDFVRRQSHDAMLWTNARDSGIFMWLSDHAAVKTQFELVARNEYTKGDTKNPVDCSLFYLALRKKNVLQGLWRMANWNKEQAATQKLLANNFADPKWKTAALKNAYALLSKRRFEYAAAFFLLGDDLEGCVNICLHQLKDLQLAIAICRVYEGDEGPVLEKILHEEVLTMAAQEGNRWLASWAFWMLGRKDMAVRALISPVYALIETPCSPDIKSRLFLTDDPSLVVLYEQLRQQTIQTLRGASKVTPKVEWEFVLHSAKLYDRMGCDLLGLDLVRNWEFQKRPTAPELGGEANPLTLLRRRSSLVVDDLPRSAFRRELKQDVAQKIVAPASTFQEPDASSLLDSFGF